MMQWHEAAWTSKSHNNTTIKSTDCYAVDVKLDEYATLLLWCKYRGGSID